MATKMQRKKPGYTKAGEIKIVSLSIKQLLNVLSKTSKNKIKAKIKRKLQIMGYVEPTEEVTA